MTALVAHVRDDAIVRVDDSGEMQLFHDGAAPQVIRERIERLKDFMLTLADKQEMHVEHELCDGMYLRKMFIPKGTLIVGKVHLKHCHNVLAKGSISILTETGCARLEEGFTGMSQPGTQKLGLAHSDVVFINVFRTDKTDLAEIEGEIAGEISAADREGVLL